DRTTGQEDRRRRAMVGPGRGVLLESAAELRVHQDDDPLVHPAGLQVLEEPGDTFRDSPQEILMDEALGRVRVEALLDRVIDPGPGIGLDEAMNRLQPALQCVRGWVG